MITYRTIRKSLTKKLVTRENITTITKYDLEKRRKKRYVGVAYEWVWLIILLLLSLVK